MRLMILTSATGGGHNMRARSLAQWAARERPHWEVDIHPVLESTHWLYHIGVELYNLIQRSWSRLHHVYFNFLEAAGMFRSHERILGRSRFVQLLKEKRPDILVSVHGSINHGFFQLAHRVLGRERTRCVTYCAEMHGGYGFSRHWVNPEADLFIGSVPETADAALDLGMPREKIRVGGFLLHPSFYEPEALGGECEAFWSDRLGLNPRRFTVILSTGANSANNHDRFLQALRALGRPIQIIVLCGQDKATRWAVDDFAERFGSADFVVRPLPTTDKMALLMRSASAIVARPGSGTCNEAIQSECPLIFNRLGGLMPQEMITERFGLKHGIATSVRRPEALVDLLRDWIDHPERREQVVARMRAVKPRQRPTDILAMLEEAKP